MPDDVACYLKSLGGQICGAAGTNFHLLGSSRLIEFDLRKIFSGKSCTGRRESIEAKKTEEKGIGYRGKWGRN